MALNPEKLKLLYNKINSADHNSFSRICAQLFNYLKEEIKDNPIYDQLEKDREKWLNWPNETDNQNSYYYNWKIPDNLEEVKSLAFHLYKSVAEKDDNGNGFSSALFRLKSFDDNIDKFNNIFIEYLGEALNDIIAANPEIEEKENRKPKGDYVFIVHGHDKELKQEVQLLLQSAGVNNIVLHEQPDKGRTIIDKLLQETEVAGYAIALLSPDDITEDGTKRARQNVILEIGYFIGRLGKERIRMVLKENVEIPSDLQGILYEKHDDAGAWKIKLLKEIQAVGIYVDLKSVVAKF